MIDPSYLVDLDCHDLLSVKNWHVNGMMDSVPRECVCIETRWKRSMCTDE